MPDPKTLHTRKPWYQRAMEMATQWKTVSMKLSRTRAVTARTAPSATLWRSTSISKSTNTTLWRTTTKSTETNPNRERLRKCSSLRAATSFTRVCLCAPISSYNEVFKADYVQPPRRSNSYPRSKPMFPTSTTTTPAERTPSARLSTKGRRVFRGKSLIDDVLMRRFVLEEEAMMQVRRRNEMEVIRRRQIIRRKKLGPSPLSRMITAEEEEKCV
ncbi:hypothetical protein K2173_017175 [Erythroxylum novogranatense]|uniref:Uncharacterized protein n=1 Tax=Erythroxylum novogranatense TaxID=1862640 RepID=A0AAV8U973_9ROSI|nr:hypothetical protein K2173_017175 [Erythroxylum novogranatense]